MKLISEKVSESEDEIRLGHGRIYLATLSRKEAKWGRTKPPQHPPAPGRQHRPRQLPNVTHWSELTPSKNTNRRWKWQEMLCSLGKLLEQQDMHPTSRALPRATPPKPKCMQRKTCSKAPSRQRTRGKAGPQGRLKPLKRAKICHHPTDPRSQQPRDTAGVKSNK